ncbi:MAG: response regulator [Armatimonadota bacterium]
MKLRDMKIGTQLRLGLSLIVLFVLILGVVAKLYTDRIWIQAKTMYDHPLQVRRAVGDLRADILIIHRCMKDVALSRSDSELSSFVQQMAVSEADANRQFQTLSDRYLGPDTDISALQDDFVAWKAVRDETLRVIRAGKREEGVARIRAEGVGGQYAQRCIDHLNTISTFARRKSIDLYQTGVTAYHSLIVQLIFIVVVIIMLSGIISWLLMHSIKTPLRELTGLTEAFGQGQRHMRSEYSANNEFGELAKSFNSLADTVQSKMLIDEKSAQISGAMLREDEMRRFCTTVLNMLVHHTGSQMGAVYYLNEAKTEFVCYESIGLNNDALTSFPVMQLKGEFGAALVTHEIQRVIDIPKDTHFTYTAVVGDLVPREILTIPIVDDNEVVAMISLARIRAYDDQAIQLIDDLWSVLTARVVGMLAYQKTKDLAVRLEEQNRELDAQASELKMQTSELTEQNAELDMQAHQLDEANRLKTAFLSNMSHELRTPLNSVIALTGVLSRRLAKTIPEEEYSYLEVIERNGKNLLALINDILDLSRIEGGHEDVNVNRFYVHDITNEVMEMIEPQTLTKNIKLVSRVSSSLPEMSSDPDKIRHIMQNLVGNAVKFTESGSVEIIAELAGDDISISVHDTGIGISAAQISHIFEEFRQADDSTSRKYGGTGLGLAIAQKYANLLGGIITVESTPGEGSTFTVKLPLVYRGSIGTAPLEIDTYRPLLTNKMPDISLPRHDYQILVVEDNEPAITQICDMLQHEGYRVDVAHNGKEALGHIGRSLPDAMILDLMMPEVDGFQVLDTIRKDKRTEAIPVLILTAKHVTKQELSFLKGNHIHQLIQKGDINKAGLLAAVAQMVAPAPVASVERRRPNGTGKPVVLVVEDNMDNMRTTKALLNDHYQLLEAENGKLGVDKARSHQPDLILMDIALPVMDGFQALKAIREDATVCDIPIIALTASAMKGHREEILAHGFDGYVTKPVDNELLQKTLRKVLYGHE